MSQASSSHSHDGHGHQDHGHDGMPHVMPMKMLLGVGGLLLFLTAVTVWVTAMDLGRSGNLIVAMVIATIKAGMVCAYFMHLRWDRPFNAMVFVSSVLFVALFISITLIDKSEYEPSIEELTIDTAAQ
jgi:cytochrome c oxidase subunit IV